MFRRRKRHIYRQILPSVGWNLYLFEHKFALLSGSLLSHALWKQYAYLGSLQGKSLAHPTVALSRCRIQHVSYEGKHGNLTCKCWKCILWSALGLVTGERAAGERERERERGHSLWNGLEPHELWRNRRYQMKFSSSFVLSFPRSEVRWRLFVAGINKTCCYLFSDMSMWRRLRHLSFLFYSVLPQNSG